MVEMSVSKKYKTANRVGTVKRILNDGQISARIDNYRVACIGIFENIAIGMKHADFNSFNCHFLHGNSSFPRISIQNILYTLVYQK
jgi:hypothetical protein